MRHVWVEQLGLSERHDTDGELLAASPAPVVPLHYVGQRERFRFFIFIFLFVYNAGYDVIENIAFTLLLLFLRLSLATLGRWSDE